MSAVFGSSVTSEEPGKISLRIKVISLELDV